MKTNGSNIIKTFPGDSNYALFEDLPKSLYPSDSQRFKLGHDPVPTFLEGCYVLIEENEPVGRFAFYENPNLCYENQKVACIGSYECEDDPITSLELIRYANQLAKDKGYKWLIGPMEGSTWEGYRFSKDHKTPNFFMEPYHHLYYNAHFQLAGFSEIAGYFSNLDDRLEINEKELSGFDDYLASHGAVLRHLNMDDFENELFRLAEFSNESFVDNFLFTPIDPSLFVAKYSQLKHLFDPELVWIIDNFEGEMQAFIFAINDYFDSDHSTMIAKTIVRKRSSPLRGVISNLGGVTVRVAKDKGYKRMIHALVLSDNASKKVSERYNGSMYKSYALYGKRVE